MSKGCPKTRLGEEALGDTASEIARLLPDLRRQFPDIPKSAELPPEQQQRYLFNELLEHMAPHVQRTSILIVVTYDDVLDAIEEAETAGLVFATSGHRENRYEFSHALVRHTLLE